MILPDITTLIADLETFWLNRYGKPLETLEDRVRQLSEGFTTDRPTAFTDYFQDTGAAAAYGLFFLPQTVMRTWETLKGLHLPLTPPLKPLRMLDLGCGSGAAALAAATFLRRHFPDTPLHITAADHSPTALSIMQETFAALPYLQEKVTLETMVCDARTYTPPPDCDLILLCFTLNEIHPAPETDAAFDFLVKLHAALNRETGAFPALLLVLEPAGRETSPRLQKIRDRFCREGISPMAPCPHSLPCPLPEACLGYCHDARHFRPTQAMRELNRRLFRTISDIKYSFLALPASPPAQSSRDFRLIGPVDKAKGRLVTRVCLGDGSIRQIEIPAKGLTSDRKHELLDRQRGDTGNLPGSPEEWKIIENGQIIRVADLSFN